MGLQGLGLKGNSLSSNKPVCEFLLIVY